MNKRKHVGDINIDNINKYRYYFDEYHQYFNDYDGIKSNSEGDYISINDLRDSVISFLKFVIERSKITSEYIPYNIKSDDNAILIYNIDGVLNEKTEVIRGTMNLLAAFMYFFNISKGELI